MITALGCDVIQSSKNVPSNIEESGETLLPQIPKEKFILNFFGDDEPKKKTGNASVSWDEIESVLEIAQEQTGEELIAVFSVRDSTGAWYNYYLQPLGFSPEAMDEAQGETQLFVFELDPDTLGSVSRITVANIPSGTISMIEFEQWILPMTNLKNKSNSTFVTEDCGWEIDVPGGSACWEGGCSYYDPEYGYYCNDNNGNDYDPNWNWPKSGGGGGSSRGSESGSDEDDCRPPYCITDDDPEPCDTNDEIMNDNNIQNKLVELWQQSNTDLQIEERSEQGGFIVESNGGYDIVNFSPDWASSVCEITLPSNYLDTIPNNVVGIVHTHPFFEGDDTTHPEACGDTGTSNYQSSPSRADGYMLIDVANHIEDLYIKGYVIDGNNISVYDLLAAASRTFTTIPRCGY
jgi:hypothetical protein